MDIKPLMKVALPLLISNWIFGVGVFHYPLGTPRPILSFIYSTILSLIHCLIARITYPSFVMIATSYKTIVPMKIFFFSHLLLTFIMIVMGWCRSETLMQCLIKSTRADNLMENIGIEKNYQKMLQKVIGKTIFGFIFVVTVISINGIIIFIENLTLPTRILLTYAMCYPVMVMFFSDLMFTLSVSCTSYRFDKLNQRLKTMIVSTRSHSQRVKSIDLVNELNKTSSYVITAAGARNPTSVIKLAKKIHLMLTTVCQEAENAYGLQILISLATSFAIITANIYINYQIFIDHRLPKALMYKLITSSSVWVIYYAMKIVCFSWVCSNCVGNAIQTGDIINKFYDEPTVGDETKSEIRDFNIQLIQKPLKFTAYGFLTLDCGLLREMTGSIITHLMILFELNTSNKEL